MNDNIGCIIRQIDVRIDLYWRISIPPKHPKELFNAEIKFSKNVI